MTDSHPVLELRGISKRFGAVQALYQVDFRVAAGEVMALVGDNGAGKSTLIKCIAGIHPADEGEIIFEGKPVQSTGPRTPLGWASRSSTRTSRWPTTWTSSRTCSWGVRSSTGSAALDEVDMETRASKTLCRPVRHDDPLRPPDGRRPVRRPAAVGRRRQGGHVELQARDPRRADRGARRRADPPGARPRPAPGPAGPRRRARDAQHARRLRGRATGSRSCGSARTWPSSTTKDVTQAKVVEAITAGALSTVPGQSEEVMA